MIICCISTITRRSRFITRRSRLITCRYISIPGRCCLLSRRIWFSSFWRRLSLRRRCFRNSTLIQLKAFLACFSFCWVFLATIRADPITSCCSYWSLGSRSHFWFRRNICFNRLSFRWCLFFFKNRCGPCLSQSPRLGRFNNLFPSHLLTRFVCFQSV